MKRRIKLSTLLKRTLLTVLGVVVLSVLLVFVFDKYKPTENTFNNKYSDDYWNQEVLEGFEYSADIYKRINKNSKKIGTVYHSAEMYFNELF